MDEVLFSHPNILEACSIGIPDPIEGQRVKSFVVLKKGERATEREVIEFWRKRLPPHAAPKFVDFEDELPRSLAGKILRKELKRRHAAKAVLGNAIKQTGMAN
jgi:long-chain acyl-CoA synthetase